MRRSRVERYLRTGKDSWGDSGESFVRDLELHRAYSDAAKTAIRALLQNATAHLPPPANPVTTEEIRHRIEPMVRGMLPAEWQEVALQEITRRTFVLDLPGAHRAIEAELSTGFLGTAQQLLFATLRDHGVDTTGIKLKWEGVASGEYAHIRICANNSEDPYSDVVVHEAAHLLHYLKPAHYGFKMKRGQERFVDVEFAHRELFAYSCEAYARVLNQPDRHQRIAFAEQMSDKAFSFPRGLLTDVASLVLEATKARNGWKVIRDETLVKRKTWREVIQDMNATAQVPLTKTRSTSRPSSAQASTGDKIARP